jgi:Tol biopolymer transport system component
MGKEPAGRFEWQTRLTFQPATDNYPRWSPDGTRIVFISYRDGTGEINGGVVV